MAMIALERRTLTPTDVVRGVFSALQAEAVAGKNLLEEIPEQKIPWVNLKHQVEGSNFFQASGFVRGTTSGERALVMAGYDYPWGYRLLVSKVPAGIGSLKGNNELLQDLIKQARKSTATQNSWRPCAATLFSYQGNLILGEKEVTGEAHRGKNQSGVNFYLPKVVPDLGELISDQLQLTRQ